MQSIKNIYEKIYDFENLHKAWEEARKGKRYRDDVLIFNRNYEEQLINIQNHLIYETYEVGKYHTFYVYEPKKRLIMSLPFKDRIVQWAIYRQLFPLYEKTFIFDSYACRKGKGTHKAADRLQYWLRQTERKPERYYYLKMDIATQVKQGEVYTIVGEVRNGNTTWGKLKSGAGYISLGYTERIAGMTANTPQDTSYRVKINTAVLNVRKGPGTNYPVTTQVKQGEVYTIVGEEKNGNTTWGKLKSGAGYISLGYTQRA